MRKLGWFAVSAMVATMIVFSVLLLAANLYVQSQGAQQRIRQSLNEALHVPVTLKKTTLTPWEGLRLDGITLQPQPDVASAEQSDGAFLTADSFSLRVSWWPLLVQRRLEIDDVLLDHPHLAWAQNTDGRWVWPQNQTAHRSKIPVSLQPALVVETPFPPTSIPPTISPGGEVPQSSCPSANEERSLQSHSRTDRESSDTPDKLVAAVGKFRVRHGSLDLLDQQRLLQGQFEEIDLDGQLRSAGYAKGELRVQRITHVQSGLLLKNFSSNFVYDDAEDLNIEHGKGNFAGGELLADYQLHTGQTGSPFTAECHVDGVNLSQMIKEAGSKLQFLEGRLQGAVNMKGLSDNPAQLQATGQLKLIGAEVKNFPVLQMIGDLLRIEDLSHLQFKTAELDCHFEGEILQISPLSLASNNLRILAQGRYSTKEDQLEMHGRLTIDQAISHQLPEFIEMNFTASTNDAPGSRYIDFDVTGPLNKPTTNLFDRIMAGPTHGLLQNLLAPKPKKSRQKGAKGDQQPTTPAAVPPGGNR